MSRREVERRKFRQALVPGLVLSAVVHAVALGLGGFGVPAWDAPDPDRERVDRAEEWQEESLEVVTVRPRPAPAADSRAAGASSPARPAETAATSAPTAAVRAPSPLTVATEPVDVPSVAVPAGEREERLSASDLAALFPDRSEMPRPTSRAAREASGERGNAGDGFRGVRGTRRAGPRGGGCVVRPGTAINRRFPESIAVGGG